VEPIKPTAHATVCATEGKKCAFLGGRWAGSPKALYNFWVKQLIAAQNLHNF